jgi:hypothetical protein
LGLKDEIAIRSKDANSGAISIQMVFNDIRLDRRHEGVSVHREEGLGLNPGVFPHLQAREMRRNHQSILAERWEESQADVETWEPLEKVFQKGFELQEERAVASGTMRTENQPQNLATWAT